MKLQIWWMEKMLPLAGMSLWVVERDFLSSIPLNKQPVKEMWMQVMASFFDTVVPPSNRTLDKQSPGQVLYYEPWCRLPPLPNPPPPALHT